MKRGSNRRMGKSIIVLSLAVLVALECSARIVHTPRAALVSGNNPSVVNGATWSFGKRIWWNDSGTVDTPLEAAESSTTPGLVGFASSNSGVLPYVLVNNTSQGILSDDIMGDSTRPDFVPIDPILPGELVMHPDPYSTTLPLRPVFRFTVPRDGRYSLAATFRPLNGLAWPHSVQNDVSILLDGSLIAQETILHPNATERKTFTFEDKYLLAGQTIDVVIGPGFAETHDTWSHQGDAVGVTFSIVEEDETELPIEKAWDLGTVLAAEWAKEPADRTIPFAAETAAGLATWGFYHTRGGEFFFEFASPQVFDTWETNAAISGPNVRLAGLDDVGKTEHVSVCNPDGTSAVLAGMGTQGDNYPDRIGPGELIFHPHSVDHLTFRFIVPEDGRYIASYALRDVSLWQGMTALHNGVNIYVLAGSVYLDEKLVSRELGPAHSFTQVLTPPLKAGMAIDLMVSNRGFYAFDGTAGKIQILKLKSTVPVADFCAATALRANANGTKANPFTDAAGATWTMGMGTSPDGSDFTLMTQRGSSTKFESWENASLFNSLYPELPVLSAPINLESISNGQDSTVPSGQILFPNEFYVHPSSVRNSNYPIYVFLRFSVPHDGVYSVDTVVRDLNGANSLGSGQGGIRLHVMGAGFYAASGLACCDANNVFRWSHPQADLIYLRTGENIDVCVAPRAQRQTNCDATSVYENIRVQDAPVETMIGVDIRTSGCVPAYALRGRVGWGDQLWNTTMAAENSLTAEYLRRPDNSRTQTSFTISREGGIVAATAQDINTLLNEGVVSSTTNDVYTFTLAGLPPAEKFTFYLYGTGTPVYTVGDVGTTPTMTWSRPFDNDVAILEVTSSDAGTIVGTFASSIDAASVFCGIQIAGDGFLDDHRGFMVIIR